MGAMTSQVPLMDELEDMWAWRSRVRHYAFCGAGALLCLFFVWSPELPWETDRLSPLARTFFVSATLACLSMPMALWAPRRKGAVGEPTQGDGAVHLPIRRGRHVLMFLAWLNLAAMCLIGVALPDAGRREGAAIAGVVIPVLFYFLPKRLMTDHRLRLEPKGFWYSQWLKGHFVHWADVRGVEVASGPWGLRILLRRNRHADLMPHRYRWTPSALGAVITYYAEHPEVRAELTDVRALDKFRDVPVAVSTD